MGPAHASDIDPPLFSSLTAHPVRWRLLQELVRSDRAVKELVELVDEPQNLVSYHLRLLREGGLVEARRSSADRRDNYYSIDLEACSAAHEAAGRALHPAFSGRPAPVPARRSTRRPRVLFLCTGNSARSQIAEALTEHMSGGTVDAASAGSDPKPLHPNAIRVVGRRGIDISARRSKHLEQFVDQRFDAVITLCDRVREVRPAFPFAVDEIHWSVPDPSVPESDGRVTLAAFERTAVELETRIAFRLHQFPTSARRPVHA